MSIFVKPGETVAGASCDVHARKVEFKGLHIQPLTNQRMVLYELSRNCSVEVLKELAKLLGIAAIHQNTGDKIQGDSIQLWVDAKRDILHFVVKEGTSGRHGSNIATTHKPTIASIKYSFHNLNSNLLQYTPTPQLKNNSNNEH